MVEKVWKLDCDNCGDEFFSHTGYNGLVKHHSLYRKKSVNPLADELADFGYMREEVSFCCDECAEEYFSKYPNERAFYKKVKPKKNE